MDKELLSKTAAAMVAKGKGHLAPRIRAAPCEKRFKSVGVECTEENRRVTAGCSSARRGRAIRIGRDPV